MSPNWKENFAVPGNCIATEGLACEGWTPSSRQDKTNHTVSKEVGSKPGVQRQRKWANSVFHHRQAC